jgi:hypothetical protein
LLNPLPGGTELPSLIAEMPCGATIGVPDDDLEPDAEATHSELMTRVGMHRTNCAKCRAFREGAGGVSIRRTV